jgi:glycosyltransferase EpsE
MGIYNCAETLPEALDSLYNQSYMDFKLILCDDASTDETYQVAKSYAAKYANIVLIRNKQNLKLAASLNRCLEYADTEYVARMDGDDISLPTRFEKEIGFLDSNQKYAVVSCPMTYFDESGNWGVGNPTEKPTKDDFKKGTPFAHGPCMIRRNVMKEVNGYTVNKFLIRGQDYYLWYKIYKKGYKGYNIRESLYKMRDDRHAIARRTFRNRFKSAVVRYKVLRDLDASSPAFFALLGITKAFVPSSLMTYIRKRKMGR